MRTESYVYLLANKHNNVLYTGVTNDLIRRIYEHQDLRKTPRSRQKMFLMREFR